MPVDLGRLLSGGVPTDASGRAQRFPAAVLTCELQRGVVGDLAALPELAEAVERSGVVPAVSRLLTQARRSGIPVVHCTVAFRADRAGTARNTPLHAALLRRPDHLLAGTPATELVAGLGAEPDDLVVSRAHGVSPFTGTALDATLRALGVRVVVVTGVSLNVAVVGCCVEAVNLGYQVVVPADAVAGVPADYAAAVLEHTIAMLATRTTVDELVTVLSQSLVSGGHDPLP